LAAGGNGDIRAAHRTAHGRHQDNSKKRRSARPRTRQAGAPGASLACRAPCLSGRLAALRPRRQAALRYPFGEIKGIRQNGRRVPGSNPSLLIGRA
jgi:hypothetical protein